MRCHVGQNVTTWISHFLVKRRFEITSSTITSLFITVRGITLAPLRTEMRSRQLASDSAYCKLNSTRDTSKDRLKWPPFLTIRYVYNDHAHLIFGVLPPLIALMLRISAHLMASSVDISNRTTSRLNQRNSWLLHSAISFFFVGYYIGSLTPPPPPPTSTS